MKTAKSIIVVLYVLLTAQIASAYYCPSTGRWLARDPIGEPGFQTSQMASVVPNIARSPQRAPSRWINRDPLKKASGKMASFAFLRGFGLDLKFAHSIAMRPVEANDYMVAQNRPTLEYDLLGLSCQPITSGQGSFQSNIWGHRLLGEETGTLTFVVCCPLQIRNLLTFGVKADVPPPPPTPDGNSFPNSFNLVSMTVTPAACYTIVIRVTTTQSIDGNWDSDPFINHIRIVGQCCDCQGPPAQINPKPLPQPPQDPDEQGPVITM